jgi:cellulose synthase/poly-beta-1,6-N-acetylglucosamine synthase-like glycosyltransferase
MLNIQSIAPHLFETAALILTTYFLFANFIFLLLLIGAFFSIRQFIRARPMVESLWKRFSKLGPPISVIAPAFNEENSIVESLYSFLTLQYPRLEVILVNDGSTDSTFRKVSEAFKLEPIHLFYNDSLSKSSILGTYCSNLYPNLFVIDKVRGGKADSINVGIGFSRYDFFCAVDSDSILDRDALLKVVLPFIEKPETTVASGGTIRPVNGSLVRGGQVYETRLSKNPLVLVQIVEYLRAFLFGRVGWNLYNGTMIISGAFGVFKKAAVLEVGGYSEGSLGEDMELVVRLRHYAGLCDREISIAFIADPVCWTEVPATFKALAVQRDRWQRGLAEVLFHYKSMLFNPKYGSIGLIAYPYFFFVELFGPWLELFSYIFIFFGYFLGWVQLDLVFLFLIVDWCFGILMSFGAILIEESAYHKYPKLRDLFTLLLFSFFEQIGFRQLHSFWRLRGTIRYFRGIKHWGKMERIGFN